MSKSYYFYGLYISHPKNSKRYLCSVNKVLYWSVKINPKCQKFYFFIVDSFKARFDYTDKMMDLTSFLFSCNGIYLDKIERPEGIGRCPATAFIKFFMLPSGKTALLNGDRTSPCLLLKAVHRYIGYTLYIP